MKSQVLWFVVAQATIDTKKEIIIPPDGKGTFCQCFTHHVVSDVDKERAKRDGIMIDSIMINGIEVENQKCTMAPYVNQTQYNATHCYSPIGECFHHDEWHISGSLPLQDKLHSEAEQCDWELKKSAYGCIIPPEKWLEDKRPGELFAESMEYQDQDEIKHIFYDFVHNSFLCALSRTKTDETNCCEGSMCNTNITMDNFLSHRENCYMSPVTKIIYSALATITVFIIVGVIIFAIKPRWIKSLCQVIVTQYETNRLKQNSDEANPLCPCKGYCHCHPSEIVTRESSPRNSREDGTTGGLQSNNTTITNLPSEPTSTEITDGMKDSERGPALLVVRTIARQITISERVGSGRYGEVYQGEWQGTTIAVKKFHAWDDKSWQREYEIYGSLTHKNILGFVAADNKDNGQWTELWLITEYHEHGSIFDYLTHRTVTPLEAVKMISTAVNGLEYIHKEIIGTSGKTAIAHRDVKSKNILVKANGECCIGDLGLAIRSDWTGNEEPRSPSARLFEKSNLQVGTKRYMAPEVLNNTLDQTQFNNFKRADVYSMALVMWEVLNRTQITPDYKCQPYRLPYYEHYSNDPSLEQMHDIIVVYKHRPDAEFDDFIFRNKDLLEVKLLLEECWSHDPMARLPTLRVKKSLYFLYEKMMRDHQLV